MKKFILIVNLLLCCSINAQWKAKDYTNILKSKNIYEINAFLRDAHPNDPRRSVLKPKVMEMMNDYIKNAIPGDQRVRQMQEMIALLKRRPSTKISFDEMNDIIRQKKIAILKDDLAKLGNATAMNVEPSAYKYKPTTNMVASAAAATAAGTVNAGTSYVNSEQEEFEMLMSVSPTEHKNKTVDLLNSLFDNDPNSKTVIVMIENKSDCDMIIRMEGTGHTKYRLPIPSKSENSIVIDKGDYLFSGLVCGAQYASQKTVQKAIMVSLGNPGNPSAPK